jgi:hypothetical protein
MSPEIEREPARHPAPGAIPLEVRRALVEALARLLVADLERQQASEGAERPSAPPEGDAA